MAKIAIGPAKNSTARKISDDRGGATAEVERLAYQFFVERGYQHGHHEEDWLRAETIVRNRKRL